MHAYASDSIDRKVVPWVIAAVAVATAYLYSGIITWLKWEIPWWVEAPSILSVYGLGHWVYSRHVWRRHVLGLKLSSIPDFSGTWFGRLESSDPHVAELAGMMTIHQTWTNICVEFECEKSRSFSLMAVVNVTPGMTEGLTFEYANSPRHDATETMNAHVGLNHLRLSPGGETLEGDYFSGRGRQTFGRMTLRRVGVDRMSFERAQEIYTCLAAK